MKNIIAVIICVMSISVLCATVANADLLAHFSFDDGVNSVNGSFAGIGTLVDDAAIDHTTYKIGTGSLRLDGGYGTGESGQSGEFDGVSYSLGSVLSPRTNSFTITVWVRSINNGTPERQHIIDKRFELNFYTWNNNGNGRVWSFFRDHPLYSNTFETRSNTWLDTNTWTHLALVIDRSANEVRIYSNGVLSVSSDGTIPASVTNIYGTIFDIGYQDQGSGTTARGFNGYIDDVGIWDEALSVDDIYQVMSNGVESLFVYTQAMPVAYFPFDTDVNSAKGSFSGTGTLVDDAAISSSIYKFGSGSLCLDGGYGTGESGQSGEFDGVSYSAGGELSPGTGSFTVTAWVRSINNGTPERQHIIDKQFELNFYTWNNVGNGRVYSFFRNRPTTSYSHTIRSNTWLDTNTWTHLALVIDRPANEVRIYGNGILSIADGRTISAGVTNIYGTIFGIGYQDQGSGTTGRGFNGYIDDVGIWTQALDQVTIQHIMNYGVASMIPSPSGTVILVK